MTLNEAIEKREQLLVEQRQVKQAQRILESETFDGIRNGGIKMAIGQYKNRYNAIDNEIRVLADEIEVLTQTESVKTTEKIPDKNTLEGCEQIAKDLAGAVTANDYNKFKTLCHKYNIESEIAAIGKLLVGLGLR